MKIIERKQYLDKLMRMTKTQDIKVITGIRRSGKSVLMQEFAKQLSNTEKNVNLVIINLQELEHANLLDYKNLHEFILSKYQKEKYNVLIIDEVQLCEKFELVINSIHAKNIYDIYVTGSNAFLLSSDLATLFTGRTMEIKIMPFSFTEYTDYYNEQDTEKLFEDYVLLGGLAGSYAYDNEKERMEYIRDVYKTIIIRDLVNKYKIINQAEFNSIAKYLMDNIGNILSPNNICNALNRTGSSITRKTVSKYINYLENAFLMYEAKRYDLKGKKYLQNNNKYYLVDVAFRYAINGTKNMDYGRAYENMVYLELLRRGYEVYIGKLYTKEIDFIALKQSEKIYIQVSDDISSKETLERELSPLMSIKDAYPKVLLARTKHPQYDIEGVQVIDIVDWLLEK